MAWLRYVIRDRCDSSPARAGLQAQRHRHLIKRVGLLFAALVLVALSLLDQHWKSLPLHPAQVAEADVTLYFPDFPEFQRRAEQTRMGQSVRQAFAEDYAAALLALRHETGIRPTPTRWALWLGYQALFAHYPTSGWVFVCSPGLLLRCVLWLDALTAGIGHTKHTHHTGELSYMWRDGHLWVFRTSQAFDIPPQTSELPPYGVPPNLQDMRKDQVLILWDFRNDKKNAARAFSYGWCAVSARDEVPFSGWFLTTEKVTKRNTLYQRQNGEMDRGVEFSSVSAARIAYVMDFAEHLGTEMGLLPFVDDSPSAFASLWGRLLDLLRNMPTTPLVAEITQKPQDDLPSLQMWIGMTEPNSGGHPLLPLLRGYANFPFQWQTTQGAIAPVFGNDVMLCCSQTGEWWLFTSTLASMRRCLATTPPLAGDPNVTDFLSIRWDWFGALLNTVFARARTDGLLDSVSDEQSQKISNLFRGLRAWGRLRATTYAADSGGCRFEGSATLPETEQTSEQDAEHPMRSGTATANRMTGARMP